MGKRYSEAQKYVHLAKKRLLNNDYADYERKEGCRYYVNNKRLTQEQLETMATIADEILSSDTLIFDALSRLIVDKKDFSSLCESDRVKYILDLSKIYAEFRNGKEGN